MPYGTVVADVIQNTTGYSLGAGNASIMKNRIINGAMVIDQRNAGASVTPTASGYTLDRWFAGLSQASKFSVKQNAGSVTPPVGFTNYLGITSLSAYTVGAAEFFNIQQRIEGFNVADLDFGKSTAKTITLSFWVRSSLTGTFGGSLRNNDGNRSYPFSYTISAANTWEQKSITISGDTTGTWLTTNGAGVFLFFSLGAGSTVSGTAGAWAGANYVSATGATSVVGTNGATFYITGVQLEVGSSATGFEYVNYQTSLANCQRYYYKTFPNSASKQLTQYGATTSTTIAELPIPFPVTLRTAPTALEQDGTAGDYTILRGGATTTVCSAVPTFANATTDMARVNFTVASGLTASTPAAGITTAATTAGYLAFSAEL